MAHESDKKLSWWKRMAGGQEIEQLQSYIEEQEKKLALVEAEKHSLQEQLLGSQEQQQAILETFQKQKQLSERIEAQRQTLEEKYAACEAEKKQISMQMSTLQQAFETQKAELEKSDKLFRGSRIQHTQLSEQNKQLQAEIKKQKKEKQELAEKLLTEKKERERLLKMKQSWEQKEQKLQEKVEALVEINRSSKESHALLLQSYNELKNKQERGSLGFESLCWDLGKEALFYVAGTSSHIAMHRAWYDYTKKWLSENGLNAQTIPEKIEAFSKHVETLALCEKLVFHEGEEQWEVKVHVKDSFSFRDSECLVLSHPLVIWIGAFVSLLSTKRFHIRSVSPLEEGKMECIYSP